MKTYSFSPHALFIIALAFVACSDDNESYVAPDTEEDQETVSNRIMPLGASRVEGARPEFESYRYELWKELIDGGWTFDLIGTRTDPASYPNFQEETFDTDHEGRGGWTSGQIAEGITGWLNQAGSPDIVLFSSPGGNDALQGLPYEETVANINQIIDAVQAANPEVIIIIEQLAPARSDAMTPELEEYFGQIQQEVLAIAAAQTSADSPVIVVDMASGFNDSFYADEVHYNEAGADFVAKRYYEILVDLLE